MVKPMISMISKPMDAKHVGGVNVMGTADSEIDSYFKTMSVEPDELPSHTFVATGKIEVPRRSDTIASTIRRPSVSLKTSLSKLRRSSVSHYSEMQRHRDSRQAQDMGVFRSASAANARPLRMQSSLSRLRQKVGLDRDLYDQVTVPKPKAPERDVVPELVSKDNPPLRARASLARLTTTSSIYTTAEAFDSSRLSIDFPRDTLSVQRQSSTIQRKAVIVQRHPSVIQRRPFPISAASSGVQNQSKPPVRPKRVDSGTAIEFHGIPVDERPLGFKEIMAVQSIVDRMALYKKTRDYWATADHGLMEWTERAVAPKSFSRVHDDS